ncbi:AraC family transcriptional regulator [Cohnella fermenti]|uniref:Helix-turn-helix domain-containing protein n=1 Tax=Cohnella fermenti TaxID=2565925 RepID=A0A4S4BN25_9BACL|nr:helix-turn-helix domain-containing protein [Cohnella fermenti]THF76223.1 helix-turn-helix domain-containing protein [Cohnella fermenti]
MNRKRQDPDLRQDAAGLLGFKLQDVRVLRDAPRASLAERAFLEARSHLLIVANCPGGRLVVDGHPHVLRPGLLLVCAPGQLIEWTNYSGHSLELLLLDFATFAAAPAIAESASSPAAAPPQPSPAEAEFPFRGEASLPSGMSAASLIAEMADGWSRNTASARLRCEARLLELLSVALDHQERQTEFALEACRLELERHYASDITVDSLASVAGLSRFHFMRLFKERFGKGAMEYRTELRLQEAKRLMREGDLPLAEIVYRIGYSSESYFSTLFKKQTGIAPVVYQRNQRRRIAAYSWANIGQLLALRMIPCAAPLDQFWTDRYRSRYSYEIATPLSHRYDFNLQALSEARPDFILGFDGLIPAEEQVKLRELAPSLFLNWEDDWRAHLRQTAAFLDREDEAEEWLSHYEARAASIRERMGAAAIRGSLLVLLVGRDRIMVLGRRSGTVLYDDLGLAMPRGVGAAPWFLPVEASELAAMEADRMLVHVDRNPAAEARWTELTETLGWRRLPAVQAGKVKLVSGTDFIAAPWNEYAAEPIGRFLESCAELL